MPRLPLAALVLPLAAALALAGCARTDASSPVDPDLPGVTMYKSPTCGCCTLWGEHMEEHGFAVEYVDIPVLHEKKAELGVPGHLGSCHTAVVGDYVVEGHVPAEDVKRLLRDRPEEAVGIAVPGMPIGSPGMEMPGRTPDRYEVVMFDGAGRVAVFAQH